MTASLSKPISTLVNSFSHPLVAVVLCIIMLSIIMHLMSAFQSRFGLSLSPSIPPFAVMSPLDSSTTVSSWFDCLPTEHYDHGITVPSATLSYIQKLYAGMLHSFGRHWKNDKPRAFSTLVCADQLCLFYDQMVVPFAEMSSSSSSSTIYTVRSGGEHEEYSKAYYSAASEGGCGRDHPEGQIRFQPSKVTKKQPIRAKLTSKQLNGEGVLPKVGTKTKKTDKNRRYGCPFSKHNPDRYEGVYHRACTLPPGLESKRIIEHLRRVHSNVTETKCKFCGHTWVPTDNDDERLQELHQHFPGQCAAQPASVRAQPEYMTRNQELVIRNFERDVNRSSPDEHWVFLYMRLFPGATIPSPEYDYYVERHRTPFSSRQRMATQDNCLFGVFTVRVDSLEQITSSESDTTTTDSLPRRHNSESVAGTLSDGLNPHNSNFVFVTEPWSTILENANTNTFQAAQRPPVPRPSPDFPRQIQGPSPLNAMVTTNHLPAQPELLPSTLTANGPAPLVYDNLPVPEPSSDGPRDIMGTTTTQLGPDFMYQSPDELQEAQEIATGSTGLFFGDNTLAQGTLVAPEQVFSSQDMATVTDSFATPGSFQPQPSFQTVYDEFGPQEQPFNEAQILWGDDLWQQNGFDVFENFHDGLTELDAGEIAPDDTHTTPRGPGQ